MAALLKCPGLYCGRTRFSDGNYSDCGVCPAGFRSVLSFPESSSSDIAECVPCTSSLELYDWFYLLFMALALLVFEWYIIDYSLKRRNLPIEVLLLHLSALLEVVLAALLTIIATSEHKSFLTIRHCGVYRLSDWYTLFFNPNPDFMTELRCTQEAVYPLYSMVFLFYLLALILLLGIRPLVIFKISHKNASRTICLTMYLVPGLAFCHAVFCGLIYYWFPFVTLIGSIISIACHFACRLDQRIPALFLNTFKDARSVLILIGHCGLHAFGIISLTEDPKKGLLLMPTVFLPSLFYIATSPFSDPSKLNAD